jgi:anti-sigma factor RsiW
VACAEALRVQAYFDGELDAPAAVEIEGHLEACSDCRALLADLESLRDVIRRELTPTIAPALRERIGRALDAEAEVAGPRPRPMRPSSRGRRSFWLGAFSGLTASAVAAALLFVLLPPLLTNTLPDELVSAHLRSLMPAHLIDVESSDHHTVKPWFSGHADVSPVVADFPAEGYHLVGGRADYLEQQRAAVVVYQHGPHVINVFSWEGGRGGTAKETTRNGYRMIFWTEGDLQYCAVSDTGWDELRHLVRLLQQSAPDNAR